MLEQIRKEPCKKVQTFDAQKHPNGFLLELYKDGPKTTLYLTAATPGAQKGYHLHTRRSSHLVCVRGQMKVTVVEGRQNVVHVLDARTPERLFVPTNVWILYENVGEEEGWMINFPSPPYDPDLVGEQQEKTPGEIAAQLGA